MTNSNSFYPSNPSSIPNNLTSLTKSYKTRAGLAIAAIILFFALYALLVYSLGYLTYWAITFDVVEIDRGTIFIKVASIAGSAMLFIFALKFIFKLKNHKAENRIKLDIKKHPGLRSFIYKICEDTNAPKPKSVYLDPDVNAYVSYTNMWLSLIFPTKKDLTIGMGLINSLNLSEFKAVMAHEFGHFAQSSMKIGSYIISANTIIYDMIYTRDRWDRMFDTWRGADIRLSAAAWIITPIVWVIRKLLELFYQLLNLMYSSLSREMEFNADKVAISVAGSDGIISALWKLNYGFDAWTTTMNHAYLAAPKNLFVKNLYLHNAHALKRVDSKINDEFSAFENHDLGGKKYFSKSEASKVSMYASHPPNDHREQNAKQPFVFCETDERSPWTLFQDPEEIQEQMTLLIYDKYLNKKPVEFTAESEFETFVENEQKGNTLLEEYQDTFKDRFITIPESSELEMSKLPPASAAAVQNIKSQLKVLMKPVEELNNLVVLAHEIAEGTSHEKTLKFGDKEFSKKKLNEGLIEVHNKREQLYLTDFIDWDKEFCLNHLAIAKSSENYSELLALYEQHRSLVQIYKQILALNNRVFDELNILQQNENTTQSDINSLMSTTRSSVREINELLVGLEKTTFIPLPNIENVKVLQNSIVDGGEIPIPSGQIFENGKFDQTMNTIQAMLQHLNRIDQKSISNILDFQHQNLGKL